MGRISASFASIELKLLDRLAAANAAATLNTLRMAGGHYITAPRDDPSGFIAVSQLQTQASDVNSALKNVTAASSIVSQAQLALDQMRTQLESIRTYALADQNGLLDPATRAANQAGIDAAVEKINQLSSTTINGRRILDGSADFTTTGANNTQIASVEIASLGPATSQTISGSVTTPAAQALLTHTEATGSITNDATFTLAGQRGNVSISISNGDSLATVAQRINAQSDLTGVSASVTGNDLKLTSVDYGSKYTVAVTVTSGTFAVTGGNGNGTANGVDAVATINGQSVTGAGNTVSVNSNGFQFSVQFQAGFSGAFSTVTASGHGLNFALTTDPGLLSTLAIPGLQPSRLGGPSGTLVQLQSGGTLSGLAGNSPMAVRVADEAIAQLTRIEGRVSGFANATISASSGLLNGQKINLADAIQSIDGVDAAVETQLLKRNQALAANAITGLKILNQQRASILTLLQPIVQPSDR
jgi:flagellin-like hook-associated protein FlgL